MGIADRLIDILISENELLVLLVNRLIDLGLIRSRRNDGGSLGSNQGIDERFLVYLLRTFRSGENGVDDFLDLLALDALPCRNVLALDNLTFGRVPADELVSLLLMLGLGGNSYVVGRYRRKSGRIALLVFRERGDGDLELKGTLSVPPISVFIQLPIVIMLAD